MQQQYRSPKTFVSLHLLPLAVQSKAKIAQSIIHSFHITEHASRLDGGAACGCTCTAYALQLLMHRGGHRPGELARLEFLYISECL